MRKNDSGYLFNQKTQDKKVFCTTDDLVQSALVVGGSVEGAIKFLENQGALYDEVFGPVYDTLNGMK